jgi:hypothetical protein
MKAGATQILTDFFTEAGGVNLDIARGDSAYLCDKLANSISSSMGGTSGALLELFFRAVALNLTTEGIFSCCWYLFSSYGIFIYNLIENDTASLTSSYIGLLMKYWVPSCNFCTCFTMNHELADTDSDDILLNILIFVALKLIPSCCTKGVTL